MLALALDLVTWSDYVWAGVALWLFAIVSAVIGAGVVGLAHSRKAERDGERAADRARDPNYWPRSEGTDASPNKDLGV